MEFRPIKHTGILSLIGALVILSFSSCGGGGGGGGGGSPAPTPPQTILSGTVQAPGGQIAFSPPQNIVQKFVNLLVPPANALISGISPVADGTVVELDTINDSGGLIAKLATTSTSGGNYTFNLNKLNLAFSSNMIVRVSNSGNGVQMRAFAGIGITNISPVSETAVRIILNIISTNQGVVLANFTPKEENDILASMDLVSTLNQVTAGLDIESTVTAIQNTVSANTVVMAFITSTSGPGQTNDGPGDIGNFVPLTTGNTWNYQRTDTKSNSGTSVFVMTDTISGTTLVNGIQTYINRQFNYDNTGASREGYWAKDSLSYSQYGESGSASTLVAQIAPVINAAFPLQPDFTFVQFNRTGLNFGQDLDGDGINESVDVAYQAKVASFETVTVQIGTFNNAARYEYNLTLTVHLSRIHQDVVSGGPITQWFAPGVGSVKTIQQINTTGLGQTTQETISDELTSYTIF